MLGLASYLLFLGVVVLMMRLAGAGFSREQENTAAAMLGASTRLF